MEERWWGESRRPAAVTLRTNHVQVFRDHCSRSSSSSRRRESRGCTRTLPPPYRSLIQSFQA